MKARNREVNIFNMSLLDILCGALGAFCFLMLALFPYYKPANLSAEDRQTWQNAQQTQQKLQQLENQLRQQSNNPSPQLMQRVQGALSQARQQLAQTQQQLDRTRASMEQAQRQVTQAEQQAQKDNSQLQMKEPMIVQDWSTGSAAQVDLYIQEAGQTPKGDKAPPFDPTQKQSKFFSTTQVMWGPGSETWSMGETVAGNYPVYYRLEKPSDATGPVTVAGGVEFKQNFIAIPNVTLSQSHPWALAATIVLTPDRKVQLTSPGGAPLPAKK